MAEKTNDEKSSPVEQQRLEQEQIEDLGSIWRTRGKHAIHCLTVVGQVEGHVEAPQGQKTTKYEHVIPQLVAVQEDPGIEGLLVLLNTVGGDVEAGLALAELIASISKPSAAVVLGGGHSIGIPLAVSARRSFIVPTATMTIHPVRHSGMILGVPQTMRWFEQMQDGKALHRADAPHRGAGDGCWHGAGRPQGRAGKAHRPVGRHFGCVGVVVSGNRKRMICHLTFHVVQ